MGCFQSCFRGRQDDESDDDHIAYTEFQEETFPLLVSYDPYETELPVSVGEASSTNSHNYSESIHTQSFHEDFCPTCFEEYTEENPKITAKCKHHYHLGCIYEWQERSETCPTCRQVIDFSET